MRLTGIREVYCITSHHRNRQILPGGCERIVNIAHSGNLTCKQEDGEVSFLLDGATPIPGARQPTVDATTGIIEVIRS